MATTTTREFNGLRWGSDRLADGTHHAFAWLKTVDSPAVPFLWTEKFGDEFQAYNALRVEVLRYYRTLGVRSSDGDTVANEKGERLAASAEVK